LGVGVCFQRFLVVRCASCFRGVVYLVLGGCVKVGFWCYARAARLNVYEVRRAASRIAYNIRRVIERSRGLHVVALVGSAAHAARTSTITGLMLSSEGSIIPG